jgi:hypothetical protein
MKEISSDPNDVRNDISKQLQGEIPNTKKISKPKRAKLLLLRPPPPPPPRRNDPRATDLITCCPFATSLSSFSF